MRKMWLLIGAGVGYVLGSKAGRERYDQIAEKASQVWGDPRLQSKIEEVKNQAPQVASKVTETVQSATGKAKSRGSGQESTSLDGDYSSSGSGGYSSTGSYDSGTGSYETGTGYGGDTGSSMGTGSSMDADTSVETDPFGPGGERLP